MTSGIKPDPAQERFALFFDSGLSRATPYDDGGDYIRAARPRLDRTFTLIQRWIRNAHVADIGASPFYLLDKALASGARRASGIYFAYDEHPLKNQAKIYSKNGVIELFHSNIESEELPFGNDSVDILLACEILEHCEYFPLHFSNEIRRVVRPGGIVCLTVPNVASLPNITKLILNKNIFMKYRADPTGRHKHEYTMSQLRDYVDFLGLKIIAAGWLPFVTSNKTWPKRIYRLIGSIPWLRRYSPKLYIVARQPDQKQAMQLTTPPKSLFDDAKSIEV